MSLFLLLSGATKFGSAYAAATDLPELTTDEANPKWYTIKNLRNGKYVTWAGDGAKMTQQASQLVGSLFYFMGEKGTFTDGNGNTTDMLKVKLHSKGTDKLCATVSSWTTEGNYWYITARTATGLAISSNENFSGNNCWNDEGGRGTSVGLWGGTDPGSIWVIEPYVMPTMSTENSKTFYTIKNVRKNKYANYYRPGESVKEEDGIALGSYWYFVDASSDPNAQSAEGMQACRIYNAANNQPLKNPDSGVFEDQIYYIRKQEKETYVGFSLGRSTSLTAQDSWNDFKNEGTNVGNWSADDLGSIWDIKATNATDASLLQQARGVKTAAEGIISDCEAADYYKYPAEAISAVKAATDAMDESETWTALRDAIAINKAMETLSSTEKTAAPQPGDYIQLRNKAYGTYLTTGGTTLSGTADALDANTLWLVEGTGTEGQVKLKNVKTDKYMGTITTSQAVNMVEEAGETKGETFTWSNVAHSYAAFQPASGGNDTYGHIDGSNKLVGWNTGADATQWIATQITIAEADTKLQEAMQYFGTGVGQYTPTAEIETKLEEAKALLSNETRTIVDMMNMADGLFALLTPDLTLAPPSTNMFLRIRTAPERMITQPYLVAENHANGKLAFRETTAEDINTIFYLDENNRLVGYANGLYPKMNSNSFLTLPANAEGNTTTCSFSFPTAVTGTRLSYNIIFNGSNRYMFTGEDLSTDAGNDITSSSPKVNGYSFRLEEVTELPVKISNGKKLATFWSPVDVTVPNTVDVYTVTVAAEQNAVVLEKQESGTKLAAGTGVLLHGDAGTYNFAIENTATGSGVGALTGQTYMGTYTYDENSSMVYTLQTLTNGKMGFKKYNGTVVPAFKGYLDLTGTGVEANALSLIFADDATGVENIEAAGTEKAAAIYDLSGRRVSSPKKGIYIVNGVKVIIK